jgi:predicted amidophosphoribosyltransferase
MMENITPKKKKKNLYFRNCKYCKKPFKSNAKAGRVCDDCIKERKKRWAESFSKYWQRPRCRQIFKNGLQCKIPAQFNGKCHIHSHIKEDGTRTSN